MANYAAADRHKAALKSLNRKLKQPERKAKEDAFEAAHLNDTDEELYEYVKALKRRYGKKLTGESTIGYRYLVQRLGSWDGFMGKIGLELKEEALACAQLTEDA